MRGLHISVLDMSSETYKVVNDEYSNGKKLFWYRRRDNILPKCLKQMLEFPRVLEYQQIMWVRCPNTDGLHEGASSDIFYDTLKLTKGETFEVLLQYMW